VGVGAHILVSLGVKEMRLLSRQEKKYIGLRGFGLDIVDQIHLDAL
jgi:3,4-dihydroxy 2-butanone 4-phosphate synthase/GTP cyclohydrolase II